MTRLARYSLAAVVGWMGWGVAPVSATPVELVGGNVGPSTVFDADVAPAGEWAVDSTLSGALAFGGATFYDLGSAANNAHFAWTGNPLVADNSAGGVANGTFGAGGMLTVTGKLYLFGLEVFDGVLMEGSVSGFGAYEVAGQPNFIDMLPTAVFTPTGGALVGGAFGLEMPTPYYLTFTGGDARQGGGGMVDFQSDVSSVASFQWNMFPVPEPHMGMLLLAGLSWFAARRRR